MWWMCGKEMTRYTLANQLPTTCGRFYFFFLLLIETGDRIRNSYQNMICPTHCLDTECLETILRVFLHFKTTTRLSLKGMFRILQSNPSSFHGCLQICYKFANILPTDDGCWSSKHVFQIQTLCHCFEMFNIYSIATKIQFLVRSVFL